MSWEAVFFDFDGVIVDSVNIKTEAFGEMFRPFGADTENKVVDYHIKHLGVSRYEKFRIWHKEYLGQEIDQDKINELSEVFSSLVLNKVLNASFIKGAVEALDNLLNNQIPMFVVSGTPEDELRHIVYCRQIDKYFAGVYGSPLTKPEIVKRIIEEYKYDPAHCLFIGDAMADYQAAKQYDLKFLGIIAEDKENIFPDGTMTSETVYIPSLDDFTNRRHVC